MKKITNRVTALIGAFCLALSCVLVNSNAINAHAADEYQYIFCGNEDNDMETITYDNNTVTIAYHNGGSFEISDENIINILLEGENSTGPVIASPSAISARIADIDGGESAHSMSLITTSDIIYANFLPLSGYITKISKFNGDDFQDFALIRSTDDDKTVEIEHFSDDTNNKTMVLPVSFVEDIPDMFHSTFFIGDGWELNGNTVTYTYPGYQFKNGDTPPEYSISLASGFSFHPSGPDDADAGIGGIEKTAIGIENAFILSSAFDDNPYAELELWGFNEENDYLLGVLNASGYHEILPFDEWPELFDTSFTIVGASPTDHCKDILFTGTDYMSPSDIQWNGDSVTLTFNYENNKNVGTLTVSGRNGTAIKSFRFEDWGGINVWFTGEDLTFEYKGFSGYTINSGSEYRIEGIWDDEHLIEVSDMSAPGSYDVTLKSSNYPFGPDDFLHVYMVMEENTVTATPTPSPVITSTPVYIPPVTTPTPTPVPTVTEIPSPTPVITVTNNSDGSTTTTTVTENADGSTTKETKVGSPDGSIKTDTVELDKAGNLISKTEEEITTNKKGTEIVETSIENADGSTVDSIVKTTTAGKVVSEIAETDSKGKLTITLETIKPDGSDIKKSFLAEGESQIKLTDYDTEGSTAVVPGKIKINNKSFTVTTIGKKALAGNKNIKKITLSDSITTVGKEAFRNAENLAKIELSSGITKISKDAFAGIAANARFYIKAATEIEFNRIVNLIKKSGVSNTVRFKWVK